MENVWVLACVWVGLALLATLVAHSLLYDWSERTFSRIQRKFDAYANSYRGQVAGLIGDSLSPADQKEMIRRDLVALENT